MTRQIPITEFLLNFYYYLFHENEDHRVKDWFLMSSPFPTILTMFTYGIGCLWVGPYLMTKRKPFQIRHLMTVYNAFQVCFSFWIFSMAIRGGWFTGYSFRCEPLEFSDSPQGMMMAKMMWWYYISKFVDMLDTIFFILRKKYNHISFLHMGHHGGMPFACWYGTKFLAGGHGMFVPFLNSFVHTIMYSYYFLAGLGPSLQKFLWWKKYLTILQMVQFMCMLIHHMQLLFVECKYPSYPGYWGFLFGTWILKLFYDFYAGSYKDSRKAALHNRQTKSLSNGK